MRAEGVTTGLTQTGMMGTIVYAAPELLSRPQEAGVAADVYGLAMTAVFALYGAMLTYMDVVRNMPRIIDQLPIEIVEADRPMVFSAAHFKARYPISYADAFSAVLAKAKNATLLTGDPEFKVLENEIDIHWLPR